jgi:hypothetical protein
MPLTKASFAVINVAGTITSTTVGNSSSIPSITFDQNGVISTVSNTGISGAGITANSVSNSAFQTGSVENYLRGANLNFGMRNRIINGAMQISQRGTSFTGLTDDGGKYTLDRWRWSENGTMDGAQTVTQDSSANTVAGFTTSLKVETTTAKASLGTDLSCRVEQFVEGLNAYDLAWGTVNARPITVSFWVRSSLTGTHGGSIRNSADNRSYPFSYTIAAADTWEQKFITIPGDTTGTWLTTNGTGLRLTFSLGAGTSLSGPANTWAAAGYQNVTGAVSVIGTLNATWYITGVQLEEGLQATSFEYRQYSTEFDLCRRYCEVYRSTGTFEGNIPQGYAQMDSANRPEVYVFYYPKRTSPSIKGSAATTFGFNNASGSQAVGSDGPFSYVGTSTTGTNLFWNTSTSLTPGTLSGINNVYFIGAANLTIDAEL